MTDDRLRPPRRPARPPSGRRLTGRPAVFHAYRRRRRLLWWIIPAVIGTLVLALLTGAIRTDNRRLAAYFDQARPLLRDTGEAAGSFSNLVRNQFGTITRDDFDSLVDRLHSQVLDNRRAFSLLERPPAAEAAAGLQTLAFRSWSVGLDQFRAAVLQLVDDPLATAPVDSLASAIADMRVGDLLYELSHDNALSLIDDLDVTIGELPQVAFVSSDPVLLNADILARAVRNSTAMAMRSDVGVLQVVFDPLPTGAQGQNGEMIFPADDRLRFSAVIGNRGNVDQKSLFLSANFRNEEGVISTQDSRGMDLAAGENRSVLFDAVPVEPGRTYSLSFNLTVADDEVNAEDNTWESGIRFNPAG